MLMLMNHKKWAGSRVMICCVCMCDTKRVWGEGIGPTDSLHNPIPYVCIQTPNCRATMSLCEGIDWSTVMCFIKCINLLPHEFVHRWDWGWYGLERWCNESRSEAWSIHWRMRPSFPPNSSVMPTHDQHFLLNDFYMKNHVSPATCVSFFMCMYTIYSIINRMIQTSMQMPVNVTRGYYVAIPWHL